MVYKSKLTKEQIIKLLDEMQVTDEIEIMPLCLWRNGRAIKVGLYRVSTSDHDTDYKIRKIKEKK